MRNPQSFGWMLLAAGLVAAQPPRIATDLKASDATANVDVIVRFKVAPTEVHHQRIIQRGGALKREMGFIKSGAYSLPASRLAELAADPDVEYISPDRPVYSTLNYAVPAVEANIAQK